MFELLRELQTFSVTKAAIYRSIYRKRCHRHDRTLQEAVNCGNITFVNKEIRWSGISTFVKRFNILLSDIDASETNRVT